MRRMLGVMGLLLVTLAAPVSAGVAWSAHGLAGVGVDGNPLERMEGRYRQSDSYARLEADIQSRGLKWAGAQWNGLLRWGADRYVRERGETRQMVRGGWRGEWSGPTRRLGLYWMGTWRFFPHTPAATGGEGWVGRDTRVHEIGLEGQLRAAPEVTLIAELSGSLRERAHAAASGTWDSGRRQGLHAGGEVQRTLTHGWRALARIDASRVKYDRPGVTRDDTGAAVAREDSQHDESLLAALGVARAGAPLARLTAGIRRTWSNSYGVGFRRLRFDLLFGLQLPWRTSLVLSGRWEPAEVRSEKERLVDPQADADDPDFAEFAARDALTLRCVRPLAEGLALELQTGWERSEARLPWERYEKATMLAALRYSVTP